MGEPRSQTGLWAKVGIAAAGLLLSIVTGSCGLILSSSGVIVPRLEGAARTDAATKSRLSALEADLGEVKADLKEQRSQANKFWQTAWPNVSRNTERIEAIEQRLEAATSAIEKATSGLEVMASKAAVLETKLDALSRQLDGVASSLKRP